MPSHWKFQQYNFWKSTSLFQNLSENAKNLEQSKLSWKRKTKLSDSYVWLQDCDFKIVTSIQIASNHPCLLILSLSGPFPGDIRLVCVAKSLWQSGDMLLPRLSYERYCDLSLFHFLPSLILFLITCSERSQSVVNSAMDSPTWWGIEAQGQQPARTWGLCQQLH